jgi:electron transfer flavoprotein alpha subunit
MSANRTLTLLLPHAPLDQEIHDRLVSAACAAAARGDWADVQVLVFVPPRSPFAVHEHAVWPAAQWFAVESEHATPSAGPDTWARLAQAALADPALKGPTPSGVNRRVLLWPATPTGEAAAAILSARLGIPALGRCLAVSSASGAVVIDKAGFGDRIRARMQLDAAECCGVWRPASLAQSSELAGDAPVHRIAVSIASPAVIEHEPDAADSGVPVEGARCVVSGGRGMKGDEGFVWLSRIADKLGAAVGGSLPAVDAGWVPVARQVGQSGKFVSAGVYLAVGISGTPQHLAGIAPTTRIFAVNNDPEAPIFQVAEVGVLADWKELLPLLYENLERLDEENRD